MVLYLFEFEDNGFFAARDQAHAFELVVAHVGCPEEELDLEGDYRRQVPDDEEIDVWAEETWDDSRETIEHRGKGAPREYMLYGLKISAREWIEFHCKNEPGYAFGGME